MTSKMEIKPDDGTATLFSVSEKKKQNQLTTIKAHNDENN